MNNYRLLSEWIEFLREHNARINVIGRVWIDTEMCTARIEGWHIDGVPPDWMTRFHDRWNLFLQLHSDIVGS
jgi:hypothetical protein